MNNNTQLDDTDMAILRTLQQNAKLTTKELAEAVHLSVTPVFERTKRLERMGIIKKYVAVLDARQLQRGLSVFCQVKLRHINRSIGTDFERQVLQISEVTECYNTSGAYDYILKVHVRDMNGYQEFLYNKLGVIEGIGSVESIFVMNEIKQDYGISI